MRWQKVLVLGGSMAGLLAARVLSEHFEDVFILERDTLPDEAEPRNGTPQARHLHQILASGQQIMEDFFPKLKDDLREVGAPNLHWGVDGVFLVADERVKPVPSGIITNTCSRPTLEYLIRRRLCERGNIHILQEHRVQGLISSEDKRIIKGVQVKVGRETDVQEIYADLVIDCTGRNSKSAKWYAELGYGEVENTYINAFIGYSTCWFEHPDTDSFDFVSLNAIDLLSGYENGRGQRSGIILRVENDRWIAILTGNNIDYPPTDYEGFLNYAQSLQSQGIYDWLKDATPISPVYGSRSTYSIWHHYEKMARLPENMIITGDAACAFNPVYGQGMSVAALDAKLLGELLSVWSGSDLIGFSQHFQKELAETLVAPWNLATTGDKAQPLAEGDFGEPTRLEKFGEAYSRWTLEALIAEPEVLKTFFKVMNMLEPPEALGKPSVMLRVFKHKLFGQSPVTQ